MRKPKVSVIVPNYNHVNYLPQRLDSIFNQTFQDFDVILLDDCSTDNSREILNQYRNHPKVSTIIFNEHNSGSTFIQWDKGIKLANGEFIWIAESDDWCEPTLLEVCVDALCRNSTTTLSYVQSYFISGVNRIEWISKQDELERTLPGNDFIKKHMVSRNAIFNASMAVFRRSAYYQVDPNFKNFIFCGDWLVWIGIAGQGDVFISGKVLNYFRSHDTDVSGKSYASGINFVEELQILFNLVDKNQISDSEFLTALMAKHINFKLSKYTYSQQMVLKIEALFYLDEHTKLFNSRLKRNYIEINLKRKMVSLIKKFVLWK